MLIPFRADRHRRNGPGTRGRTVTLAAFWLLAGLLLSLLVLTAPLSAQQVTGTAPGANAGPGDPAAASKPLPAPPGIAARAAVMINADDGRVLYSLNPDEELPMASTTKMMTALLTIEDCKDLSKKVTASKLAATVGESSIYLTEGEQLTVQEMLNGMLIPSGNDAATALAEFDAGSVDAFVAKMNKRAAELGMTHTHFANPHGLDDPNHYTSAADFARLATELMKHPELREIVARATYTIPQAGNPAGRELINNNHLLEQYPYINGIKTGYTDNAGQCIMISGNQKGLHLIVSYLGGPSLAQRGTDIVNMLQFGFDSYSDRKVVSAGEQYAAVDVPFEWDHRLALTAEQDVTKQIYASDEVQHRIVLPEDLTLPVHKGDRVGLVEAYDGDTMIGTSYLVANEDVGDPGVFARIGYYVQSFAHIF